MLEYRYLVVEHSVERYAGLVAAIFSALGVWLGVRLTRTPPPQAPIEAAATHTPDSSAPMLPDPARGKELGITPRELEILGLIAAGLSNREIAETLCVSENTVKTHSSRVFGKLNARRRTEAVRIAKVAGLLP